MPLDIRKVSLYTYGKIVSKAEIMYGPAYNAFDPNIPPSPIRLKASQQTTSIASALKTTGKSILLFSAENGISVFAANNQKESSTATVIHTMPIVRSATQLSAETRPGITWLYGVSVQGELFYTTCSAGHEDTLDAWSTPITLISQLQTFAFFIDKKADNNTIFALAGEKNVFQLTQDPVTHDWASRAIILPGTDLNDVIKFDAFNTRITVQSDDKKPLANQEISITATSPIGVYVNNFHRVLNPSVPFIAKTDASGVPKICQPTQDFVAICYQVTVGSDSGQAISIDPAAKAKDKLASIKSRSD